METPIESSPGKASPIDLSPARARLLAALGPDTPLPLPAARVVVRKSPGVVEVFDGDRLVRSYPAAFGSGRAAGPKRAKGDGRTPEGAYFVCTRNGESRFHLFLGINYPNAADARAGAEAGVVAPDAVAAFERAERERRRPPWDGPLGGAIGLHGGTVGRDWTQGCVAVENDAIEEIWVATRMGTPVEIVP